MATEFNYRRAWEELAQPYYNLVVDDEIRGLLFWVANNGQDLKQQDGSLDVPIPAELLPRFEALPTRKLAVSACTIYFWGHWGHCCKATVHYPKLEPKLIESDMFLDSAIKKYIAMMNEYGPPEGEVKIQYHRNGPSDKWAGATWKFSNMADQVLRRTCGLPQRGERDKSGITLEIREGRLFACWSGRSGWTSTEIGWGTPDFVHRARQSTFFKSHHDFESLKDELAKNDADKAWFYMDFMDHKEGTKWDDDELPKRYQHLVENEFLIKAVRQCNYNPHPFTIGQNHFDNGTINVHKAGCAFRGKGPGYNRFESCGLPFDKHTHEVVMFLECKKTLANKEAAVALFKLKGAFEADKVHIDGFAFVENEAGHVIQPPEPQGAETCSASDTGN
jgi:hypothetical protein